MIITRVEKLDGETVYQVESESGNTYTVKGERLDQCNCVAGSYGRLCRHVKAVAEKLGAAKQGTEHP
jgi:hypothetical protein